MKKSLLIVILFFLGISLKAQFNLDSLYSVWQDEALTDSVRIKAFSSYISKGFVYSAPDSAEQLANEYIEFGVNRDNLKYQSRGLYLLALSWHNRAEYPKAIEFYLQSLKLSEEVNHKHGIARCFNDLGAIYEVMGDYKKAREYHKKCQIIYEELGYSKGIAHSYNNLGNIDYREGKYSNAREGYTASLKIREQIGDLSGIAASLNNIGLIYEEEGNLEKALDYYKRSLELGKQSGDSLGVVYYLNNIGLIYINLADYSQAIEFCNKGKILAEQIKFLEGQKTASQYLYRIYKALNEKGKALEYHESFTRLKDSIFNKENTKKATELAMNYEFEKKKALAQVEQEKKDAIALEELRRQKYVRNGFIGGFTIVLLFAGVFFIQRNRIGKEKERSEELLLNILPEETAQELKEDGHSDAKLFDHVTVLFTDFKGFTALSEKVTPKQLVKDLHECFSAFDRICEQYGIEKIKTIGDAYMAAGGLPSPNTTHAKDIVNAALEMTQVIEHGKAKKNAAELPFFEIRIGVHSGPVVAGIVGLKKFQYDIWGDTVNTASRMESSGNVGQVNISQATYELLKDDAEFAFESRGKIEAKGKGEIEMYFVSKA